MRRPCRMRRPGGMCSQQHETEKRRLGEVERHRRVFADQTRDFGVWIGGVHVDDRKVHRQRWLDHLQERAIAGHEARAKNLVTVHHLLDAAAERLDIERAGEPQGRRHVVRRPAPVQLVHEPDALLRERHRRRLAGVTARERRGVGCRFAGAIDHAAQLLDGRRFEEPPERQGDVELGSHARDESRGEQRMPAEIEKVFVDAHLVDAHHVTPDPEQRAFGRRSRGPRARPATGKTVLAHREPFGAAQGNERTTIDLPAAGERQRRQDVEPGRYHELRQRRFQMRPARRGVHGRARCRRDVRDQSLGGGSSVDDDGGLRHAGVPGQHDLDLARLHAEPADLDLAVAAAQELDVAVREDTCVIAGAIQAASRCRKRIGNEALRREIRTLQVAIRDHASADVQLAHHSAWHRLEIFVQDIDVRAGDRASDRRQRRPLFRVWSELIGGDHVRLGRPVVVVQLAARQAREQRQECGRRSQLLAGGDHPSERRRQIAGRTARRRLGESIERHEREEQPLDRSRRHVREQGFGSRRRSSSISTRVPPLAQQVKIS